MLLKLPKQKCKRFKELINGTKKSEYLLYELNQLNNKNYYSNIEFIIFNWFIRFSCSDHWLLTLKLNDPIGNMAENIVN
jgi:hypothetical protein